MTLAAVLSQNAYVNIPASPEQIASLEKALGVTLPDDYKQVLLEHNGYSSSVGGSSIILWQCEEIIAMNNSYKIRYYLPGMIGFGSDGGPNCLVYDFRNRQLSPEVAKVPFGDLGFESLISAGKSLTEFVQSLTSDEISPKN